MRTIQFHLVEGMERYADDIESFVLLMLEKLDKNQHKGRWENLNVEQTYEKLTEEVLELRDALVDVDDTEAIIRECADVANFAMILAAIQRERPHD